MTLLVFLVLAVVAYRATTAAERVKIAEFLLVQTQRRVVAAEEWYRTHQAFFDGLRARKRVAPVTSVLFIVNMTMFVIMVIASFITGRDALVEWGASVGPRTTNGEWWRLVTSLFVHSGSLHLLACLVGLVPLGLVLERLVGSVALAAVYLTSGVFAGLATLSGYPMAVSAGASGAICGVYGLAFATLVWGLLQQPRVIVPWGVLKWLAAAALIFLGYNIPTEIVVFRAELTGFIAGVCCGAAIGKSVGTRTIPAKRSGVMVAATLVLAIGAAVPLRGITDVRPDIDRMRATDERTAATYRAASARFTIGRTTEKAMVALIERDIIPALESERPRLASRGMVPDDQKALVADAAEYLRLRIESWHLRATALRKGSPSLMRQADNKEGEARDLLVRIPYPLAPT